MLTARSLEKDLELAFDVGASGYITKPFRTRELADEGQGGAALREPLRAVPPGAGPALTPSG